VVPHCHGDLALTVSQWEPFKKAKLKMERAYRGHDEFVVTVFRDVDVRYQILEKKKSKIETFLSFLFLSFKDFYNQPKMFL